MTDVQITACLGVVGMLACLWLGAWFGQRLERELHVPAMDLAYGGCQCMVADAAGCFEVQTGNYGEWWRQTKDVCLCPCHKEQA
jgi:hypothetical protein